MRAPSRGQLEECRKQDLLEVAAYLGLTGVQHMLKNALKEEVLSVMERRKLLSPLSDLAVLPFQSEDYVEGKEEDIAEACGATEDAAGGMRAPERGEDRHSPPPTPPRFDPDSPGSRSDSLDHARFQYRLARLKQEAENKQRERDFEMRKLELEADTRIKLKRLELEVQAQLPSRRADQTTKGLTTAADQIDVGKCMMLMPPFREAEVDSYFAAFERIATSLSWPQEVWTLLLQCKLTGKAQEVMSALSVHDFSDYDRVKEAVLQAYELVPEAYRQKFRSLRKRDEEQTYVEFSREKSILFDKWVMASKVISLTELRELVLLEEFKRCLPEKIVLYLNEQKAHTLSAAAVLADEFMLTHRIKIENRPTNVKPQDVRQRTPGVSSGNSQPRCFYCHKLGHIVKNCLILKSKKDVSQREVGFIAETAFKGHVQSRDRGFDPFVFKGTVHVGENDLDSVQIEILRDTGASQTLILESVLPFNVSSCTNVSVLLRGLSSDVISCPVHEVNLKSELVTGKFKVAVCKTLPVAGVHMLLGNDIAGGAVIPVPQVITQPQTLTCVNPPPGISPSCVVTRAGAVKSGDDLMNVSS
ncbi:uncharacterized protein [Nothobranchius furzeri]|uniref:uncharacterized protein n=1 Tax=Nothobranchius furzeri TaxID=105023 RepID=UPI003904DD38